MWDISNVIFVEYLGYTVFALGCLNLIFFARGMTAEYGKHATGTEKG